ncbi:hypothetical protein [Mycolicibacterium holsaticum]|uniref:Phage gp6-like head-tail connector protein n=1 Tax=Mycolicibacterium holsaticum TaxID=152142 RepID=A0A1E3R5X8_9MYCO|nr:hypothetical protein [Mycolicibacterium holsaticum]ODQ85320.1 hypothetical protein BHQ17_23670 [Mycolicibacterium holsaticum]
MAAVTGQDVADFLGQGSDTALVALAGEVASVVTVLVKAYTRGRGFDASTPNDELGAVITTASARLVANPEQLSTDVGSVSIRGGFAGWSLAETFVLNRYRKTAL